MNVTLRPLLFLLCLTSGLAMGARVRTQGFAFGGVTNRVLTPNGDGKNDSCTFQFANPRDSAGTIKIYDLRGHEVASIAINSGDTSEKWDGRSGGQVVSTGVYVYVIRIEDAAVSGTVVVIK